jgi:acyl-CoA synthetase (AMP-forming)/AMP-acid ligase II
MADAHRLVPGLLVGDVLRQAAARTPARVAATLGDQAVTFAELDTTAAHLTAVLAGRGVGRGDRVAWWADTSLECVALYFALAHLGAVFVPLNSRCTAAEAELTLAQADPVLVVTDDAHPGQVTVAELLATRAPSVVDVGPPDEDDPHVIFFTSGTTGEPKGVVLTQRTQRLRAGNGTWPGGATICMFPQFHMAGWASTLNTWLSGDQVAYVARPDAEPLLEAVERHRAQLMYAIPSVWRRILDADRSAVDVSSLKRADTGTSTVTEDLLVGLAEAFPGAETSIAYGSTEASAVCMLWPADVRRKIGSVGPPAAGVSVRLDEVGELWATSAQLFTGYFRNPGATSAALVDGWYRTGELAEVDAEGHYRIVGRVKDLIRTGGETVAPAEVDVVIVEHPAVADGAVAGVPDDDWGEVLTAFVVLRPGQRLDLADLRRHCEGRLASHKHPRRLVVMDVLPRTGPTNQIQRRRLVEHATGASGAG